MAGLIVGEIEFSIDNLYSDLLSNDSFRVRKFYRVGYKPEQQLYIKVSQLPRGFVQVSFRCQFSKVRILMGNDVTVSPIDCSEDTESSYSHYITVPVSTNIEIYWTGSRYNMQVRPPKE